MPQIHEIKACITLMNLGHISMYIKICVYFYFSSYSLMTQKLFIQQIIPLFISNRLIKSSQLNALIFFSALKKRIIKEAINAISFFIDKT